MPRGIAASPGIAIGPVYILEKEDFCILKYRIKKDEIGTEIKRFEDAVGQSKKQLKEIPKQVSIILHHHRLVSINQNQVGVQVEVLLAEEKLPQHNQHIPKLSLAKATRS